MRAAEAYFSLSALASRITYMKGGWLCKGGPCVFHVMGLWLRKENQVWKWSSSLSVTAFTVCLAQFALYFL